MCKDQGSPEATAEPLEKIPRKKDEVPSNLADFYSCPIIVSLARDLAVHYGVSTCLISLVDDGEKESISTVARYGTCSKSKCEAGLLRESRLCKMQVKRGAPVIINDASESHLSRDPVLALPPGEVAALSSPLGGIRFFVELSLQLTPGRWCGTLCLADIQARPEFTLQDAEHLKAVGHELVCILQDLSFGEKVMTPYVSELNE